MTTRTFQRIKITDVAQALGLSVSTVSRALNGYADVNQETRRRIETTARDMGYTPSRIGQKLRKGRSPAAGFVIPPFGNEFADPVFLSVLAGADERLRRDGMHLVITTAATPDDDLDAMKRMIEGDQVDSMILVRVRRDDPRIDYLHANGIPFSMLGQSLKVPSAPSVEIDMAVAVDLAMDHLVGKGRRRIAHLNAPAMYNYGYNRAVAFRDAVARHGLDATEQLAIEGELTELGGARLAEELMARSPRPDAIICANDAMAIGAIHAIHAAGLRPGADVAIIGFEDIPAASLVNPPLSTLRVPFRDLGMRVAELLLKEIAGTYSEAMSYLHKPALIIRAT
jgi:LacI family transcriptional regulator